MCRRCPSFHPAAVAVCTDVAERNAGRVKVFEQKARGHLDAARLSRALLVALGVVAVAALLSGRGLDLCRRQPRRRRKTNWRGRFRQRRAAIRAGADGGDRSPVAALERRKYETPASVIVLDALSKRSARPHLCHRNASGRQQVADRRHHPRRAVADPADRAVASTSRRATFYAPTTRAPSDPGERFHIETRVEPKNTAAP